MSDRHLHTLARPHTPPPRSCSGACPQRAPVPGEQGWRKALEPLGRLLGTPLSPCGEESRALLPARAWGISWEGTWERTLPSGWWRAHAGTRGCTSQDVCLPTSISQTPLPATAQTCKPFCCSLTLLCQAQLVRSSGKPVMAGSSWSKEEPKHRRDSPSRRESGTTKRGGFAEHRPPASPEPSYEVPPLPSIFNFKLLNGFIKTTPNTSHQDRTCAVFPPFPPSHPPLPSPLLTSPDRNAREQPPASTPEGSGACS